MCKHAQYISTNFEYSNRSKDTRNAEGLSEGMEG